MKKTQIEKGLNRRNPNWRVTNRRNPNWRAIWRETYIERGESDEKER